MSEDAGRRYDAWRTVLARTPDGSTAVVRAWLPPLPPLPLVVPQQSAAPAVEDARLTTR